LQLYVLKQVVCIGYLGTLIQKAVYNHWTGLVDWTGGLTLKIIFYTF